MTRNQKLFWGGVAVATGLLFFGTIFPPKLPAWLVKL